jgi:hypothetical protein
VRCGAVNSQVQCVQFSMPHTDMSHYTVDSREKWRKTDTDRTCFPTKSESADSLSVDAPVSTSISVLRVTTIARYFLLSPITMQLDSANIWP